MALPAARTAYSVRLPVFSGPLDLLLQLIEREELDVSKVALAKVTDQFLAHLQHVEELHIQEIADFLVIAAKLILIKSEALLPRPPAIVPDENDAGLELARLLQSYKKYKQAALLLQLWQRSGRRTFVRLATPPKPEPKLDLSGVTLQHLHAAMVRSLALKPEPRTPVADLVARPRVTIVQKIRTVAHALRARGHASFFGLLRSARSRTEIVVTFLAVLELVKRRLVTVRQDHRFGDIEIKGDGDWMFSDAVEIVPELENFNPPEQG